MTSGENKQYFGNKLVDKHRKEELVGEVFDSVADNYDLMNDLMSFGLHRKWKDELVEYVLFPDRKILDVASGTGDIAGKIMQKAKELNKTPDITITDINENMLENCKHKLGAAGSDNASYFNFITSNAEKLPVPDNSFDYYTIAFGIRNVADIKAALKEAYRVLKPYGKFLCLEFSKVDNSLLRKIYNLYSYNAIPLLGEKVAGDRASYEYLVESIRRFPDGEEFAEMIKQAGFSQVRIKTLTFGITAIHTAYKI
jgi:demethylmenaquinone methyltransferase/2-methoxy-6-polyprenyl-1,4-benzoquinol methylase